MVKLHPRRIRAWTRPGGALILLCVLLGLSACGQKGSLYLPQPEPAPETEPEEDN